MKLWFLKSMVKGSQKEMKYLLLLLGLVLIAAFFMWTTKTPDKQIAPASATGNHKVGNRQIPIYCVDTDEPKVAITFDAAWGNEETDKLLEVLDECDVKATFFMTGTWVEKYPDSVKKIVESGHEAANHSLSHSDPVNLSGEQLVEELMTAHNKVKELTGVEMKLYRPPYGSYTNESVLTCIENGYYCIQWDVDSLDWKDYGVDSIVKTVLNHKHLGNGSIILMHNGSKYTADALEAVICGLQAKGYEIVKVSELIYKDNYEIDHEGRQISTAQ